MDISNDVQKLKEDLENNFILISMMQNNAPETQL